MSETSTAGRPDDTGSEIPDDAAGDLSDGAGPEAPGDETAGEPEPADQPLPPGPDEWPLVGSTFALMRDPIGFLDEAAEYGDVVTYHVGGQRFTALLHPEYIERVLVDDFDRFRRWTGEEWGSVFGGHAQEGLLLTEGEQWRRQRQLIQEAFTIDRIESYADAMVAEAQRTAEEWDDGDVIDLKDEMSTLTLRVLSKSLFDLDISGRGEVVRQAARALNAAASAESPTVFLPNWVPTPTNRRVERAMTTFEEVVDELIEERREDASERDDLLSLLLAAETDDGTTLSETEIRDQLITFLFAGHETTALALTYALHALAHNPETMARLREEVESVTGGDPPGLADVPQMDYTEGVVKEALRLYPPAYAIFREATEPAVIGGFRIPEGSNLSLPQIHVHRDGRWFDAPEQFRPGRWDGDLEEEIPDYAYFPFGGGPRHCIGMRMAMMELKTMLPTLVAAREFEPLTGPELAFETGITLQPSDPIEMRVRER